MMMMVGKDRKKAELIKHLDEVLCDDDDVVNCPAVPDDDDGWQGSKEG